MLQSLHFDACDLLGKYEVANERIGLDLNSILCLNFISNLNP